MSAKPAPQQIDEQAPASTPSSAATSKKTDKPAKAAKKTKADKAPAPSKPVAKKKKAIPSPKAVNNAAPKSATKNTAKTASKATKPVEQPEVKTKKVKLVRDSFTIPKEEYEQIAALKLVLAKQGRTAKKSELLRAGLLLLGKQSAGALLASVDALTPIKTGRPKKD